MFCYSGGMAGQHYCLRWNNYQSNMTSVFHQLLQTEAFVDVTLACNEASLKAHKVLSTACSLHDEIVSKLLEQGIYYNSRVGENIFSNRDV